MRERRARSLIAFASVLASILPFVVRSAIAQSAPPAIADDSVSTGRGLFSPFVLAVSAGPRWQLNQTAFDASPTCPDYGRFGSAWSHELVSPSLSFFSPLPVRPPLWLRAGVSYSREHVTLRSDVRGYPQILPGDSLTPVGEAEPTDVGYQSRFDVDAASLQLWAGAEYRWENLLRGGLGIGLDLPTFSNEARTREIVTPGWVFNSTGTPERPLEDPTVTVESRTMALVASCWLGANLAAGPRLRLMPELRAEVPLGSISSTVDWRPLSITAAMGFAWRFGTEPEVVAPPVQPQDTAPAVKKPYLAVSVTVRGVDSNGVEYPNPAIEVVDAPWTDEVPLIPYVFFDSASALIPQRYDLLENASQRLGWSLDSMIHVTPLDVHWQMLNVIGRRMREHPEARGVFRGTGSVEEMTLGGGRLALARARSVRDYLVETWGIDSTRIDLTWSPDPTNPSRQGTPEGKQENRRVELSFDDTAILAPAVLHRSATVASPPAVRFYPEVVADEDLASWYISVYQGSREFLHFQGGGAAESLKQDQLWPLEDMRINSDMAPIHYRFVAVDAVGQKAEAEGTFRVVVRHRTDSSALQPEIEGYNLVGFDFDSSELQPRQLAVIERIARHAGAGTQLAITGYTDRVGDPDRNRQLARARAETVASAIDSTQKRLDLPQPDAVDAFGSEGGQQELSNDVPEGRMLSRRVRVSISRLRGTDGE